MRVCGQKNVNFSKIALIETEDLCGFEGYRRAEIFLQMPYLSFPRHAMMNA
jgi:hypothetical protein